MTNYRIGTHRPVSGPNLTTSTRQKRVRGPGVWSYSFTVWILGER